jgi:hypothetical protein
VRYLCASGNPLLPLDLRQRFDMTLDGLATNRSLTSRAGYN